MYANIIILRTIMASTIGIIGVGFVGDALLNSFQKSGILVKPYDKYKNIGSLSDTLTSDIIFLCLPTLYDQNLCEYDKSSLHEICLSLQEEKFTGPVIVKSTVEPGTSELLARQYGLHILHNPEFLTARTAREDFHNQTHIVLGVTSISTEGDLNFVKNFYKVYYPSADISMCKSWESEAMKSFVNSFYAIKVQVFTEFYLLCQKEGTDFDTVVKLMLKNGWINPMHTKVPGPDGQVSYGGACFPKDMLALFNHMRKEETPHAIIEACINERNKMRNEK